MTSTDIKIGMAGTNRPSSRVLRPPGGGHTSLFGEPEPTPINPRPKYNQQNSSNMNGVMNTVDANATVAQAVQQQLSAEVAHKPQPIAEPAEAQKAPSPTSRNRVPPGGHSSGGFW